MIYHPSTIIDGRRHGSVHLHYQVFSSFFQLRNITLNKDPPPQKKNTRISWFMSASLLTFHGLRRSPSFIASVVRRRPRRLQLPQKRPAEPVPNRGKRNGSWPLYTRSGASSVHAEWVCCMYQFVLIVVYFVCSMCADFLVQVFSSCFAG